MTQIRTVVVPIDGSELALRAVPVARAIAEAAGASITLLTADGHADDFAFTRAEQRAGDREVHRVVLDDRAPADAIVDYVLAGDDDRLLCMSTHGRGGLGRSVLGSVASDVVGAGVIDALLVGPACDPTSALADPGPITLCIDGSDRSEEVADAGIEWAELLERGVELVMAAHPLDTLTPVESDEMFARFGAPIRDAGIETSSRCVMASAVPTALAMEADRLKSPLLVVNPGARSKLQQLLVGSLTLRLLGQAPVPVLVLGRSLPVPEDDA